LTPLTSTIRKVHDASDGDREKPEFERPVTTIGGDAKQSFDEVHGVLSKLETMPAILIVAAPDLE
jgi:hypothetical protein